MRSNRRPQRPEERRPEPPRPTQPPPVDTDEDRIRFVSWDAPLVPDA
jgi:hypothetical protein